MITLRILFCQIVVFGIVFSSPVDTKLDQKKPTVVVTTPTPKTPQKVEPTKNLNNEQAQSLNNAKVEKFPTTKRNAPNILTDKNEYFDNDFYEGMAPEDYDASKGSKTIMGYPRNENMLFDSGRYRGNDYRYYDEEARRKRTANLEGIFNTADNYHEPEIRLTPEDFMILAAYRQQHRLYNNYPYGRWTDINNSIEMPEADVEAEEIYDKPNNFFDNYYDQRYQNWANIPRTNKFNLNRQRRSFTGYHKLRVPIYKRAIL